jgi:hypothetical protein
MMSRTRPWCVSRDGAGGLGRQRDPLEMLTRGIGPVGVSSPARCTGTPPCGRVRSRMYPPAGIRGEVSVTATSPRITKSIEAKPRYWSIARDWLTVAIPGREGLETDQRLAVATAGHTRRRPRTSRAAPCPPAAKRAGRGPSPEHERRRCCGQWAVGSGFVPDGGAGTGRDRRHIYREALGISQP